MPESHQNPYAAPQDHHAPEVVPLEHVESVREMHLKLESWIKAIGLLLYLTSVYWVGATCSMFYLAFSQKGIWLHWAFAFAFLVACLGQIYTAAGMSGLSSAGRTSGIALGMIGLFFLPIGTVLSLLLLYLLGSDKSRTVFSPEYKMVIEATPDMKYFPSFIFWVILVFLVFAQLGAVVGGIVNTLMISFSYAV